MHKCLFWPHTSIGPGSGKGRSEELKPKAKQQINCSVRNRPSVFFKTPIP